VRLFLLRRMPCGEFSGASRDTPLYDRPDRKDPADFELSTAMPNRSVGIPWWKPIGCTGCCILKSRCEQACRIRCAFPSCYRGCDPG